jgi:hypothetical protein
MKTYELIFFAVLIIISWPLIRRFFKSIGFWIASYFCKMQYPVSYTNTDGKIVTFYLDNVNDVIKFTNNPKLYVAENKGLHR